MAYVAGQGFSDSPAANGQINPQQVADAVATLRDKPAEHVDKMLGQLRPYLTKAEHIKIKGEWVNKPTLQAIIDAVTAARQS